VYPCLFESFRREPTATHPLYLSPVSLCIDSTSTSTAEAAPSPVSLYIDSTSTAEAAASVKPREGEARRLGGSAERPRRSDEAAVGEPALLLVDGAAALLRGCAAARRTAEGTGAEVFRRAAVAGGRGRIGTAFFHLLRFLES
jgi:hypothetical protein